MDTVCRKMILWGSTGKRKSGIGWSFLSPEGTVSTNSTLKGDTVEN